MMALKSVNSLAKIVLLTAFCLALSPIAANSQLCGDLNSDGEPPNIMDLTFLVDFIFRGGQTTETCR